MKRSWMGFVLLLILLLLGLFSTWKMKTIHEPIQVQLQQAAYWSSMEDWETAEAFFQRAEKNWRKSENFRACFADHNPIEDIDAAFAMLQVYCAAEEETAFEGACRELARKVAAVGEAHALVWWNFF